MYLLDTNVVSEFRKLSGNTADENVRRWSESVPPEHMWLSAVVIEEIEVGVLLRERRDPAGGTQLRHWLEQFVLPVFRDRILPMDTEVARASARLHVPDPAPIRDALIAATATVHSLTLATRNVSDFARFGVTYLNPWKAAQ